MNLTIIKIINIIILLFMPFLMLGVIKKTKAFWAGRKGINLLQPFFDFIKLLKKEPVYSETTSFIFKLAPSVILGSSIFAGLFVPMVNGVSIININYGFIVFAYILGLGKFFSLLGATDTGSSFEGMGASREACFTTIIEPAFFIITASICAINGVFNFQSLFLFNKQITIIEVCIVILAVLALFIMILTECSRVPVDDPATHLELTMIHEVMILDNSGADSAFISWASGIKMLLISSLIYTLTIPPTLNSGLSLLIFILMMFLISTVIGTIESSVARLRMSHVFEFVFTMSAAALVILALVTIRIYGG